MPPKKKRGRPTSSGEMYDALDALCSTSNFSPGAVEALRLAHVEFLSQVSTELAQLGNDNEDEQLLTIQPKHVDECLEKLGFGDYQRILDDSDANSNNSTKKVAASRSKSKKRKTWSTEMEAEQERLLAQSRQTVQKQQEQQKQS